MCTVADWEGTQRGLSVLVCVLLWSMQARSELMKFAVNESNKLGGVNTTKAKALMLQSLEYGLKTIEGKEKVLLVVLPAARG